MRKISFISILFLCTCFIWSNDLRVKENIDSAWINAWTKFYSSSTHLFYDYISSYEKNKSLSHLPTIEEVKKQYPNPCGYGTGMEDCMILTGTMLETVVDRYDITKDNSLKLLASELLDGISKAALIKEASGFVARGICIEDCRSYYINSSRDQYTHCVYGLWKYYNSSICSFSDRERIKLILSKIADRMIKNVNSKNKYDSLRADDKLDPLGISRMWNVEPHEAARLPMIYAAAWNVTGKKIYYESYRKYIYDAIEQSDLIGDNYSGYVYVQLLYSFELLSKLEFDPVLKKKLNVLKRKVGKMSLERCSLSLSLLKELNNEQLSMLGPDWRFSEEWINSHGYIIPQWGKYRRIWHLIREIGESALVVFMVEDKENQNKAWNMYCDAVSLMDYNHVSSCGIVFHIAAYWEKMKGED